MHCWWSDHYSFFMERNPKPLLHMVPGKLLGYPFRHFWLEHGSDATLMYSNQNSRDRRVLWLVCLLQWKLLSLDGCKPLRAFPCIVTTFIRSCTSIFRKMFPVLEVGISIPPPDHWWSRVNGSTHGHLGNVTKHFRHRLHVWEGLKQDIEVVCACVSERRGGVWSGARGDSWAEAHDFFILLIPSLLSLLCSW